MELAELMAIFSIIAQCFTSAVVLADGNRLLGMRLFLIWSFSACSWSDQVLVLKN